MENLSLVRFVKIVHFLGRILFFKHEMNKLFVSKWFELSDSIPETKDFRFVDELVYTLRVSCQFCSVVAKHLKSKMVVYK